MSGSEHSFARGLIDHLPDVVRVGPYDIAIEKWEPDKAAGANRYGEFSSIEQHIGIQRYMPTRYKAVDTFMHELAHAMLWAYGQADDNTKHEDVAGALGTGMVALFRDNPWLIDWLKKARL